MHYAMTVRTRFAPSPTGYLHVGGARTALYSWAYARHLGGKFILRIEDTDLERSTDASVQAILDGMNWLGLDWDEGPFFQMQRLARYREIAERLIEQGHAYWCYASREELEAMREAQRARGEKPRYDGRWRPENVRHLGLVAPKDRPGVLRFRNPDEGDVAWNDTVKGPISIANRELDDLVILRADGVPTYNFGVVVDDLDMGITDVIRGDDHVNNTPRQINIFRAIGADLPRFGHVPMILGPDGERLSKRHGAVSVMQYPEDGFLPEALLNYLARLGWSHGNDEVFSLAQFVEWFDLAHVSRSPAQFNTEKLAWLNQHYLKEASLSRLAQGVVSCLAGQGVAVADDAPLESIVALLRERASTVVELAQAARLFVVPAEPDAALLAQHVTDESRPALAALCDALTGIAAADWAAPRISEQFAGVLKASGLKMPRLAIPARVAIFGTTQTPAIDQALALAGRDRVLSQLARYAR
jgi:glutamyl-tRNA synthetase